MEYPFSPRLREESSEHLHDGDKELLDVITGLEGKVMISSYPNTLYGTRLAHWNCHAFDLPNNAAGDVLKRRMTEVVWCNF